MAFRAIWFFDHYAIILFNMEDGDYMCLDVGFSDSSTRASGIPMSRIANGSRVCIHNAREKVAGFKMRLLNIELGYTCDLSNFHCEHCCNYLRSNYHAPVGVIGSLFRGGG